MRFLINLYTERHTHTQKVVFLLTMRKMYLRWRCRQADSVYAINFNYIYPCEHLRQTNIDLVEWLMDIFFSPFFSLCVLSRCCVCILFTYPPLYLWWLLVLIFLLFLSSKHRPKPVLATFLFKLIPKVIKINWKLVKISKKYCFGGGKVFNKWSFASCFYFWTER